MCIYSTVKDLNLIQSQKMCFVGYFKGVNGFKFWDLASKNSLMVFYFINIVVILFLFLILSINNRNNYIGFDDLYTLVQSR